MTAKKITKFDFEDALKKLENIVNTIEKGGLGLEESLKLFSEGVVLTKKCQEAIKSAEQKVQILLGDNLNDFTGSDVDSDEDEDEDE